MSEKSVSIIIPAFNEERRIESLLYALGAYFKTKVVWYEVIVVDDGSSDRTADKAHAFSKMLSNLSVIRQSRNRGKGAAVKEGMLRAVGDWCLFADADNSTPIEEMEKFWGHFDGDIDIIIGSRNLSDSSRVISQPFYRRILGRTGGFVIQKVLQHEFSDTQCGFKCFRRDVAKRLFALQTIDGWGFDFEILALAQHLGYKVHEVPISWYNAGESRVRPIKGALSTLKELSKVKWNLMRDTYQLKEDRREHLSKN